MLSKIKKLNKIVFAVLPWHRCMKFNAEA